MPALCLILSVTYYENYAGIIGCIVPTIQTPMLISIVHLFKVRRKTHASTGIYEFDSAVIGQHIYKCVWTPLTEECVSAFETEKTMNVTNTL